MQIFCDLSPKGGIMSLIPDHGNRTAKTIFWCVENFGFLIGENVDNIGSCWRIFENLVYYLSKFGVFIEQQSHKNCWMWQMVTKALGIT